MEEMKKNIKLKDIAPIIGNGITFLKTLIEKWGGKEGENYKDINKLLDGQEGLLAVNPEKRMTGIKVRELN